ncbi:MAG: hypothetical protein Q4C48_03420 [Lachnospiraceae bacterium]|nr:hypothetical protein [Lachnospiraceae bacterium]
MNQARETEKEALCRMIGEELLACRQTDRLRSFLELLVRFPQLTTENLLLLAKQAPAATRIGTAENWFASGNPIRKGARAIRLLNAEGAVERWYDLSQTMDVPARRPKHPSEGVLAGDAPRDMDTIRELIVCLMCNAPVRFTVVSPSPWESRCTPYHPIDWDSGSNTLHILRGVEATELLYNVAWIRAARCPAAEEAEKPSEQMEAPEEVADKPPDELAWLTAALAAYVFCRRCGMDMPYLFVKSSVALNLS